MPHRDYGILNTSYEKQLEAFDKASIQEKKDLYEALLHLNIHYQILLSAKDEIIKRLKGAT